MVLLPFAVLPCREDSSFTSAAIVVDDITGRQTPSSLITRHVVDTLLNEY